MAMLTLGRRPGVELRTAAVESSKKITAVWIDGLGKPPLPQVFAESKDVDATLGCTVELNRMPVIQQKGCWLFRVFNPFVEQIESLTQAAAGRTLILIRPQEPRSTNHA